MNKMAYCEQSPETTRRLPPSSLCFPLSLLLCSIMLMERGVIVDSLSLNALVNHRHLIHNNHHSIHSFSDDSWSKHKLPRNPSELCMKPYNCQSDILCNGYRSTRPRQYATYLGDRCNRWTRKGRPNELFEHSPIGFKLMGSKEGQIAASTDEDNDVGLSSDLNSSNDEANTTNATAKSIKETSQNAPSSEETTTTTWQANNFENDYQLLTTAMARQSAMTDLQQQQRKHTLDYGFARNRRPLIRDLLKMFAKVGGWMVFLIGGSAGGGIDGAFRTWNLHSSWRRKLHILAANSIVTMTTLHYCIVGMALPVFLLALVKRERWGPAGRMLDEYFTPRDLQKSDAPSFFYTSKLSKKKAKDKDTGSFALCMLENWTSAVVVPLVWGTYSLLVSVGKHRMGAAGCMGGTIGNIQVCARLLARLGAAAALHQYPSLLFELRRADQPRPLCRSTTYMQRAVKMLLRWLPLGVAADLAVMVGNRKGRFGAATSGAVVAPLLSTIVPLCHLIALGRIARLSKCSAVSLSEASSFPTNHENAIIRDATINKREEKIWRYQLRWRTPQRISETLQSWANYFFTGHESLLFEMDEWKKQPIRFDAFSTEGAHFSLNTPRKELKNLSQGADDDDDLIPHADAIAESLSLIFRDRDAALHNATQARLVKHQESYDTKALDDLLGIAVQRTFDIGLSYDFDHFDSPLEGEDASIHQLRARMAKSAVRRKKELDGAKEKELDILHRLKENVVTATNREMAEKEMESVEQGITARHASEVERMRDALLTLIPTNADAPKGTDRYDSPIMVAEYVDLKAPVERRGELKATVESAPDSLSMIEDYVRRDFGDEAADAYRRDEIAARKKEKEMLSTFRQRYGKLKEDEISELEPARANDGDIDDNTNDYSL